MANHRRNKGRSRPNRKRRGAGRVAQGSAAGAGRGRCVKGDDWVGRLAARAQACLGADKAPELEQIETPTSVATVSTSSSPRSRRSFTLPTRPRGWVPRIGATRPGQVMSPPPSMSTRRRIKS